MAYKYHSVDDFIKVIRVMHRKSITLEELVSRHQADAKVSKPIHKERIKYLMADIQAHAQQLLHG
ncbi:uncharacterized protein METZ01_LOCUS266233 [marine metagenome]|uniref:Uncharacterized protein n=1 Tax=marine metagenome TaxID=408172 RepID=A0A382JNT2_9ZZZZ|tara:strand:+ start:311 stop:505 length:195 start_codon:yes stop_codon:yes gene_type:complete